MKTQKTDPCSNICPKKSNFDWLSVLSRISLSAFAYFVFGLCTHLLMLVLDLIRILDYNLIISNHALLYHYLFMAWIAVPLYFVFLVFIFVYCIIFSHDD